PSGIARAGGRGGIGAARRLRQRREPAAGAQRGARARGRTAYRARCPTWTAGASDADGEPGARRWRRHGGLGSRGIVPSWLARAVGGRGSADAKPAEASERRPRISRRRRARRDRAAADTALRLPRIGESFS